MFGLGKIERKVNSVLGARIARGEQAHKAQCENIDNEAEEKKEAHANEVAEKVLSGNI